MGRWAIIGDPDWAPLSAWADGLASVGVDYFQRDHREWSGADFADVIGVAIYGVRAQGRDILEHFKKRGVPVVVIDHGYMKRVNVAADLETGYLQVGLNGLGWVPASAPSSDRFDQLGVTPKARKPRGRINRAVIMGQVGYDASHYMAPRQLEHCYERLAEELQNAGANVIAYRGHPLGAGVNPRVPSTSISSLEDVIFNADLVATINSNSGLDAIIAGCPVVTLKPSHYGELAHRWPMRLNAIEAPSPERVTAYLHRLAYAQWTSAEIRAGLPYQYLHSIGAIP